MQEAPSQRCHLTALVYGCGGLLYGFELAVSKHVIVTDYGHWTLPQPAVIFPPYTLHQIIQFGDKWCEQLSKDDLMITHDWELNLQPFECKTDALLIVPVYITTKTTGSPPSSYND